MCSATVLRIALGLLVCDGGLSLVLRSCQRETLSSRGSFFVLTAWAMSVAALVTYAGRRWPPRLLPLAMCRVAFITLMVIGCGLILSEIV